MDEGAHTTRKGVETLDVEDEDTRQARIQSYLEKLNSSSHTRDFKPSSGIHEFDFGDRTTFSVSPPTELLSRIQAFLPQIEASNVLLQKRIREDPSSVDIEHIPDGMDHYIEMNLGLGVYEDRSQTKGRQSEDSEMSNSSTSESSDKAHDEDDSDFDSDASSESDIIITGFVPSRPIRPLPRRAFQPRPAIVVLGN